MSDYGLSRKSRRRLGQVLRDLMGRAPEPCRSCVERDERYLRLSASRLEHESRLQKRIDDLAQERDRLRAELEEERRLAAGARTAFLSQIEAIEARVEELKDVIADQVRRLGTAEVEDRRVARFIDDLGRAVASAHAAGVTKPKRRR